MGRPAKGVPDPRQQRLEILTRVARAEMKKTEDWMQTNQFLKNYCAGQWGVTRKTATDYINVVEWRLEKEGVIKF